MNPADGLLVYTDGSCAATDRVGSYAYVIIDSDYEEFLDGDSELDTTISRMELMGAISSLARILEECGPSSVLLLSDSEYVVKGITNRTRKRNKNVDLWDMLDFVTDEHEQVWFEHVKGHDGDHYNEMVDEHAGKLRKELLNKVG